MKTLSGPPRTPSRLSHSVQQQLNSYALAAGAAAAGIFAGTQLAEAKIIYTPANIPIASEAGYVQLDLNNDGINDFQFYYGWASAKPMEGTNFQWLSVGPVQQSNRVRAMDSKGALCATPVPKGRTIGPRNRFEPGDASLPMWFAGGNSTHSERGCPWVRVGQAYLGLKFVITGQVHYGWAYLQMGSPAYILGYAYETIANRALVTGKTKGRDVITNQPATLGHLARGASAISSWRGAGDVKTSR